LFLEHNVKELTNWIKIIILRNTGNVDNSYLNYPNSDRVRNWT